MEKFSVKQLAKLAGLSVRTLHDYDAIALLQPMSRTGAGYRFYGREQILRLQQIMFYRELQFPLAEIAAILDGENFDMLQALENHKVMLLQKHARLETLLNTIDMTIEQLINKTEKMDYNEMYKGFSKEQIEAYEKEAKGKWGEQVIEDSKQKVMNMGKGNFEALQQETEDINTSLAAVMHMAAGSPEVQALVKRHYAMVSNYFDVTPQIYRGMAKMYVEDSRFSAYYERYKTGLAEFLSKGMLHYCEGLL